jgi:hypothetical protein
MSDVKQSFAEEEEDESSESRSTKQMKQEFDKKEKELAVRI